VASARLPISRGSHGALNLEPALALCLDEQHCGYRQHDGQCDGRQYLLRPLVDDQVHAERTVHRDDVVMNLRHLFPIRRVPNRERMEPERRLQRLLGLLVPHRHVNPDKPVGSGQEDGQLGGVARLDSRRRNETNVNRVERIPPNDESAQLSPVQPRLCAHRDAGMLEAEHNPQRRVDAV
jgi:hypothetical protein